MTELPPILTAEEFEADAIATMTKPFVSKFGAVEWRNVMAAGVQHRWLVKGLLTEGELAMLAGGMQSGKTFAALDLAMCVARGVPWFDRKVIQGGVIYQAGEDPTGVRAKRLPAYVKANGLSFEKDVPFVLLTGGLNLWAGEERTAEFIAECKHWSQRMSDPLRLIVIDTYAKATTGADEISGKEVSVILDRVERIRRETGAAVLLVDHLNAQGEKVRGAANKTANIDAVLICRFAMVEGAKKGEQAIAVDHDNRKIREITNDIKFGGKVKNGDSLAKPLRFVLPAVEIGRDEDGEPITSCTIAPPAGEDVEKREAAASPKLNVKLSIAMRALKKAIDEKGRSAPAHAEDAPGGRACVTLSDWRDFLAPLISEEGEDLEKLKERTRDTLRKTLIPELIDRNYVRKYGDWVWRSNRKLASLDGSRPSPESRSTVDDPPLSEELQKLAGEIPF